MIINKMSIRFQRILTEPGKYVRSFAGTRTLRAFSACCALITGMFASQLSASTPSYGPNGTHWPSNTPHPDSTIPNVVDVDCTWSAIASAISAASSTQINQGLHIRIAPGTLPGYGSSSGSPTVMENVVKSGNSKNILVSPRDGWGTVTITESCRILNVQGVTFARINGKYVLLMNCPNTSWAQALMSYGFRIQASYSSTVTNCNAYEIVMRDAKADIADPMGYAAGSNCTIKDSVWEGIYCAPVFRPNGASDHVDSLQMYGNGFYRGLTMRDSMMWGSKNCAMQLGGAKANDPELGTNFATFEHCIFTSQAIAIQGRYPLPSGAESPTYSQAINGAGEDWELYAYDCLVFGSMYTTKWGEVEDSYVSYSLAPTNNPSQSGAWVYDSDMDSWDDEDFDAIVPYPTDTYLASIWGGSAPADTQAPSVPTGLAASNVTSSSVDLDWNASTDNVGVTGYKIYINGSNPISVTGTSLTVTGLSASTSYAFTVSAYDAASNESSQSSAANATTSGTGGGGSGLPSGWAYQDIGSPGVAGGASENSGSYTIQASGSDIWGTSDKFGYAYVPVSGDCEITARVAGLTNTNGWAKAGVMIRESLNADSRHAFALVSYSEGVAFQRRTATGGGSSNTGGSGSAPYWVRLNRSGDTLTAYVSSNGTSWTQLNSLTISMNTNVYAGLAVTSHNNSQLTTSVVDNVTVTGSSGTDTQAPSVPTGLAYSNVTTESVDLDWNASTDNVGVTGYKVYTDGSNPVSVTGTSVTMSGLSENTGYTFTVSAVDGASNESSQSSGISVTTDVSSMPIISEDFNGGSISNFTVVSGGTWGSSNGRAVLTSPSSSAAVGTLGNIAVHNTTVNGNFEMGALVRITGTSSSWNDAGVIFGYQDSSNYYYISLNESNDGNTKGIFKVVSGSPTQLADITTSISADTDYTLVVERSGSSIVVKLNGNQIASASDATFTSGKVGFGTHNDGAEWDDLIVE